MNIKKIIHLLMLFCVIAIGLQTVTAVYAIDIDPIDGGNFKVSKQKIFFMAAHGENFRTFQENKNELYLSFESEKKNKKNKYFNKTYLIKKTKINQIKTFSVTYNKNNEPKYKPLKTYKTTKSVKSFYANNYKSTITKQVKSDATKFFK